MTEKMIEAEGLTKRFGTTQALAGLDLAAPEGSILGLLGPNGAGKTTAVRILATLALPDAALDEAGVDLEDVAVHQPSLDDVFMRLTGTRPGAPSRTPEERAPELQEVNR